MLKKSIHVVIGLLTNQQNEVLIAQRQSHQYCGGMWEFPGGKIEPDETPLAALSRELQEELGITVLAAEFCFQVQHAYPDRIVYLDVWRVKAFTGEPMGMEGQPVKWVDYNQLAQYTFPEGNREVIEKIRND